MMHDPDGDARFGRTAYKGEMPSMDVKPPDADESWKGMATDDMKAAAAFLAHSPHADPKLVAHGKEVVTNRCTVCHLYEGAGDDGGQGLAPELSGYGTPAWVSAQIKDPSSKATYREGALDPARKGHMPRLVGEIDSADVDRLATWVVDAARR
jgi:mono/diheme cytochrome c family protein